MKVTVKINRCINSCPFYTTVEKIMACGHPYWKGKPLYSECIVTYDNGKDRVPDKCPLKNEVLTVKYEVE